MQEVWGWGCYKAKEGNKFFNPNEQGIHTHTFYLSVFVNASMCYVSIYVWV